MSSICFTKMKKVVESYPTKRNRPMDNVIHFTYLLSIYSHVITRSKFVCIIEYAPSISDYE